MTTERSPDERGPGAPPVAPLRFEGGVLLVLDQRRLPAEEVWLTCGSPEQVAEAIRSLAVRGAPAIGLAAAYGMALASDPRSAAETLRTARPTAVNLAWAVERCLEADDVLADSAAGGLMARGLVDRVVVGADRIAANGDVANKVGTYPLAAFVARHGLPFYVAAPLSTIDPHTPSGAEIPI